LRLKDRVAIVTGAGSGIGRASAVRFAMEGAQVVVVDIERSAAKETTQMIEEVGGRVLPMVLDVCVETNVKEMTEAAVDSFGTLHILFNNAGGGTEGPVMEITEETWYRMTDLNLKSVFLGCKHAIPHMIKAGGGAILSTSSVLANVAIPGLPSYSAAKAGVIALTRQIASEYACHNIRANCLCPGWIYTPTVEQTIERSDDPEKARQEVIQAIPLGRFGHPEEVANAALFLVSSESSFITGTVLTIDGGYTTR
jgi:NAD(P)-dependent dehydrogenase (short-subunit alcohol dehydrogenase family)